MNQETAEMQTKQNVQTSDRSPRIESIPRLTQKSLTIMLVLMCLVPGIVVTLIWNSLPPVYEGKLAAVVTAVGLPPAEYYATEYWKRLPHDGGDLILHNDSSQEWTHLIIRINGHYKIMDAKSIKAGQSRQYPLNRFISRSGARFELQYNQLKKIMVEARRPSKDRATFTQHFETAPEGS